MKPVHTLLLALTCLSLSHCTAAPLPPAAAPAPPSQTQLRALQQQARENETFAAGLAADPQAALQSQGISLAAGEQVKVLEVGSSLYLVLDPRNLATFHPNLTGAGEGELQQRLAAVRSRAGTDPDFKRRLLADPAAILAGEGVPKSLAPLFDVVDYQPATSMILIPSGIAAISRGSASEEAALSAAFGAVPPALRETLEQILVGLGADPTEAALREAAASLAGTSELLCDATFESFACARTQGLSAEFWLQGLKKYLA